MFKIIINQTLTQINARMKLPSVCLISVALAKVRLFEFRLDLKLSQKKESNYRAERAAEERGAGPTYEQKRLEWMLLSELKVAHWDPLPKKLLNYGCWGQINRKDYEQKIFGKTPG